MSRIRHRKKRATFQIKKPRINNQIVAPQVRLIDEKGQNQDIVTIQEALASAKNVELDLVEISEKADPPVVRIVDIGKYMYELEKKERGAQKKQKDSNVIKGVRLTIRSSNHDLQIQARKLDKFLQKGYKVKVDIIMKGRERGLKDLANQKLQAFLDLIQEQYKIDKEPQKQPRGISIMVSKA